jgi:5-methylcytosine-specific restriction endonuclease McrA
MEQERKVCSRCGVEHPLHFFRKTFNTFGHDSTPKEYRKTVCKACESRERIEKKNSDPFEVKVRTTITYHAQREGKSFRSFLYSNDLTVDYIKTLFKREWKLHELGFCCLNCDKPLKAMLDDFTLDLIDPTRPATRSNLRIICKTCNTGKGQKDPTEFDLESAEYRRNEGYLKSGVQINLPEIDTPQIKHQEHPLQPTLF